MRPSEMKRFTALILAALLTLSLAITSAFSASDATTAHADALHALGLFQGGSNGYALDESPTRAQALPC